MNDIDELKERIEFAKAEIRSLSIENAMFLKKAISIVGELDPNSKTLNIYASQTAPVPVAIRSKAGMIANELRSTLDALACILAGRNGKRTDDSYFPISKSKEIFEKDGMKKMRRLSDTDKTTIINLRPYSGGHPQFFLLHEADRKRKHQKLAACSAHHLRGTFGGGVTAGSLHIQNSSFNGVFVHDLEYFKGRNLAEAGVGSKILIARGVPERLPVQFEVDLTFVEPEALQGRSVETSLSTWAELVLDTVRLFE